jgi:SAM-dependent methyltransferase
MIDSKTIVSQNRIAWDREVSRGNIWTVPVTSEIIQAARQGDWEVFLTESKPVPREWFPPNLTGLAVLALASGGGQQGPILSAAGANVTVFDNSPRQLAQDRFVAERNGLEIRTIQGDMADLSVFADRCFDLIFHPVSNCFIPDVRVVWQEAYRVLRPGGILLAGYLNPVEFIFRSAGFDEGIFDVCNPLPYTEINRLDRVGETRREDDFMYEFSHTLDDQIGGQLAAGFLITSLFESHRENHPIANIMPSYIATRALKPDFSSIP